MKVETIMQQLAAKHPGEAEYLQAVQEVLESIEEVYNLHPEFEQAKIVERMVEPDRIFTFRVTWIDDQGQVQTSATVCSSIRLSVRTKAVSVSTKPLPPVCSSSWALSRLSRMP